MFYKFYKFYNLLKKSFLDAIIIDIYTKCISLCLFKITYMNIIKGDPILYKYSTPYKSKQNIFNNIPETVRLVFKGYC